ncbi:hypothetical protein HJC23_000555 [Cyclotella cryptica]|uniref:Uncharacterized protein n=1 Tax=Cyclotella cryptica TaxID=29204 RepID=A0ABD3PSZ2_9STRA|eukprot:CCRYP_011725-RA/>CCRYP_011725-RA protein AED:0.02 eAED:0.02 QI:0/-1/0/1/-1/1/1/0/232
MENIQSWSSFEHRHRQRSNTAVEAAHEEFKTSNNVADALYVSPSSTNIAQSAAALLRQAGLSGGDNTEDEEFKLKFHWMRPHPSLILEIEDQLLHQDSSDENNITEGDKDKQKQHKQKDQSTDSQSNARRPEIEASRLMKAHRYSQLSNVPSKKPNEDVQAHDGKTRQSFAEEANTCSPTLQNQSTEADDPTTDHSHSLDLPLEMPTLRINLANLVEPPLMSSWLPGEDEWE